MKLPPAARMSWNAPPPIAISRTPPSNKVSMANRCRKVKRDKPGGTAIVGLTSALSLMPTGSATNAWLNGESDAPGLITQGFAAPLSVLVVHPLGSAGGVTASKSWLK